MDLVAFQNRLQDHFAKLKENRIVYPTFALEHGLTTEELSHLKRLIREYIRNTPPSSEHWLPWIIYAAELGYVYSGDEYWQTFEDNTRGWRQYGDRYLIRKWFKKFQKDYNGVEPRGVWADTFSIISWPITHAILPKDLQTQLAKLLFYVKANLSPEIIKSPQYLGSIISQHAYYSSSRFRIFAENQTLLGQIASALILQSKNISESLILPSTLEKIIYDLNQVQSAKTWLNKTREYVQKTKLKGLAPASALKDIGNESLIVARKKVAELGITPKLVLKQNSSEWEVFLEIPDFINLVAMFPSYNNVLKDSRCIVAGASGRPLARGRLISYGTQYVKLQQWPNLREDMLKFIDAPPEFQFHLKTEFFISPGPTWLFRISTDGNAYEVKGLSIRPGNQYILIKKKEGKTISLDDYMDVMPISCDGVMAIRINMPTSLTTRNLNILNSLGLQITKNIRFWPVGITAQNWDGEGYAEWLTNDNPCIAILADHPLKSMFLTLEDSGEILRLTTIDNNSPIFIQLDRLHPGLNRLVVKAETPEDSEVIEGYLDILIREPRPWLPGVCHKDLFLVNADPPSPRLDEFWEGKVSISINGPEGYKIRPLIYLIGNDNQEKCIKIGTLSLPVNTLSWAALFNKFRETKEAQDYYDQTKACRIEFYGDELGKYVLNLEREFVPLRWSFSRLGRVYRVQLIDNIGSNSDLGLIYYDFKLPDKSSTVNYNDAVNGFCPSPSGGLYVAEATGINFRHGIIIPPVLGNRLEDLRANPKLSCPNKSIDTIAWLLNLTRLWATARITGDIGSVIRQREVLSMLLMQLFCLTCGNNWFVGELSYYNEKRGTTLRTLQGYIATRPTLGIALYKDSPRHVNLSAHERKLWFTETFQKLGYYEDAWNCEFALRMASSPETINLWAEDKLSYGIKKFMDNTVLAKAARYFILSIEHNYNLEQRPIQHTALPLYTGWDW